MKVGMYARSLVLCGKEYTSLMQVLHHTIPGHSIRSLATGRTAMSACGLTCSAVALRQMVTAFFFSSLHSSEPRYFTSLFSGHCSYPQSETCMDFSWQSLVIS